MRHTVITSKKATLSATESTTFILFKKAIMQDVICELSSVMCMKSLLMLGQFVLLQATIKVFRQQVFSNTHIYWTRPYFSLKYCCNGVKMLFYLILTVYMWLTVTCIKLFAAGRIQSDRGCTFLLLICLSCKYGQTSLYQKYAKMKVKNYLR